MYKNVQHLYCFSGAKIAVNQINLLIKGMSLNMED